MTTYFIRLPQSSQFVKNKFGQALSCLHQRKTHPLENLILSMILAELNSMPILIPKEGENSKAKGIGQRGEETEFLNIYLTIKAE